MSDRSGATSFQEILILHLLKIVIMFLACRRNYVSIVQLIFWMMFRKKPYLRWAEIWL